LTEQETVQQHGRVMHHITHYALHPINNRVPERLLDKLHMF